MPIRDSCAVMSTSREFTVDHFALDRDDALKCFVCFEDRSKKRTLVAGWLPSVRFCSSEIEVLALLRMVMSGYSRKVTSAEGSYVCVGACPSHEHSLNKLYEILFKERNLTSDTINRARNWNPS